MKLGIKYRYFRAAQSFCATFNANQSALILETLSEHVLRALLKVVMLLLGKALNVGRKVRKVVKKGHKNIVQRRQIVLDMVEDEAGEAEIGDCDRVSGNELWRVVHLQVLLAHSEELLADSVPD